MDPVLEILEDLNPGIDYATCTTLIDERYLDSLTIIALVADLECTFDITIPAVEITADNFNSAEAIRRLMARLSDEQFS